MSELAVIPDVLPVAAITVATVSIPIMVVQPPEPIVADLRPVRALPVVEGVSGPSTGRRSHRRSLPAPVPASAHVALWWPNIVHPIVPRMSAGVRAVWLLTVAGVVGGFVLVVGVAALLGWI